MRQQLGDGQLPEAGIRQETRGRILQADESLVAQTHGRDGDERLGDRATAVLHVIAGDLTADPTAPTAPHQLGVAHDAGHDRRQAPGGLLGGQPGVQELGGARADAGHQQVPSRRSRAR